MSYFRSFIFLCLVVWASTACGNEEQEPPLLTPTMLNAHPDQYDKKLVRVQGYVVVGFEQRFLFTDQSDYNARGGDKHCISLAYAGRLMADKKKINMKYVVLEGIFIASLAKLGIVQLGACNDAAINLDNEFRMTILPHK
jgi:hypothetical protein